MPSYTSGYADARHAGPSSGPGWSASPRLQPGAAPAPGTGFAPRLEPRSPPGPALPLGQRFAPPPTIAHGAPGVRQMRPAEIGANGQPNDQQPANKKARLSEPTQPSGAVTTHGQLQPANLGAALAPLLNLQQVAASIPSAAAAPPAPPPSIKAKRVLKADDSSDEEDKPLSQRRVPQPTKAASKPAMVDCASSGTPFTVRGAGDPQFNGVYMPDGTQDGVSTWRKVGGSQMMNRNESAGWWYMCIDHRGNYYSVVSRSPTPPLSGWVLGSSGVSPAPSLAAGRSCVVITTSKRPDVRDTVLILSSQDTDSQPYIGQTGQIICDRGSGLPFRVRFSNGWRLWFREHEVQLCSVEAAAASVPAPAAVPSWLSGGVGEAQGRLQPLDFGADEFGASIAASLAPAAITPAPAVASTSQAQVHIDMTEEKATVSEPKSMPCMVLDGMIVAKIVIPGSKACPQCPVCSKKCAKPSSWCDHFHSKLSTGEDRHTQWMQENFPLFAALKTRFFNSTRTSDAEQALKEEIAARQLEIDQFSTWVRMAEEGGGIYDPSESPEARAGRLEHITAAAAEEERSLRELPSSAAQLEAQRKAEEASRKAKEELDAKMVAEHVDMLEAEDAEQDVHAAEHSDEGTQLRAKLGTEQQARLSLEASQKPKESHRSQKRGYVAQVKQAQAEVATLQAEVATLQAAARRTRDEAARRDAAASASAAAISGVDHVLDAEVFMRRFVAFRQYVEMLLHYMPTKTAKTKPWKLTVRRAQLCADVVEYFSPTNAKSKLFQRTEVTFVDTHGNLEEGVDQGGLTVELYSSFFREVLLQDFGLFEGVSDESSTSVGLLPSPSASPTSMENVGRLLCKCVLDDQPLGRGIGRFVFEFLADTHEQRVFRDAASALAALADFDPQLAYGWEQLLAQPERAAGLTFENFDPDADDDELPADELPAAVERAVLAGCRHKLLKTRERSLLALRAGFTESVDLRIQLGALSSSELLRMLRGNTELSSDELLGCFAWPDSQGASAATVAEAGFAAVDSDAPRFLREIIEDPSAETGLGSTERLHLLEWATALTALPCGGLKEPILLRHFEGANDDDLPNVHTCTHEIHLPSYTSREQLRRKLLKAVEHRHDGFNIE